MNIPTLDDLPMMDESFHDARQLIETYNQSKHFQNLWGKDYFEQASSLWEENIKLFNDNKVSENSISELLLVMGFDYYAGPHIGLPEKSKLTFYRWLIATIKHRLEDESYTI